MIRKAQSAIEFVLLVGAVMLFFIGLLGAFGAQNSDKIREQRNERVKEIAFTLQDEIVLAEGSADGYHRNFTLPLNIMDIKYNIVIYDRAIFINTTDGKHALAIPTINITGQPAIGNNFIKKINGRIYLN